MSENVNPIRAQRLAKLPPYLFGVLDKKKQEAIQAGRDVIDLGVGDPDQPTPNPIIQELLEAVNREDMHRYPSYSGMLEFKVAISQWFEQRFGVSLDPQREVLVLIGSKEGLGHLPWALLDPGDSALVPDPSYPVYRSGTLLTCAKVHPVPLLQENGYLPDLYAIEAETAKQAKLLFLNYPNNPTGAVADVGFFEDVVEWGLRHNVMICNDAAYAEIAFDGFLPPSLLSVAGAKDVAVEFHSLSKTFNMTGWRVGFAVGNPEILGALADIKKNVDSGVFSAIQYAGIEALNQYGKLIGNIRDVYRKRRDILVDGLKGLGWKVDKPKATFYVWAKVPSGGSSSKCAARLLDKADISVAPGIGFGSHGEGYIRFALTVEESRLVEAVRRIKKMRPC